MFDVKSKITQPMKSGNSLYILVPHSIKIALGLTDDTVIKISELDGKMIVEKVEA